ncbi:MAG TPA: hypothetical protein DCX53_03700 [Anaerolineae bacterium]|nr:hypothetical protein [Anaerolineae bacterium]
MNDEINPNGLRILFVHSGSDLYGASRSLLRLSTRLVTDRAKVMVVLPDSGPLSIALSEAGVDLVIHSGLALVGREKLKSFWSVMRLLANIFSSMYHIRRVISEFKPDLIHSVTAVVLSAGPVATISGIPHVWHIRESFGEFGGLWVFYQFYLGLFSSRIICVSSPIADQFAEKLRARKVCVIHNGFPRSEFENVSEERKQAFLEEFSLTQSKPLVGVVGRIKNIRKGQEVFVEAASLLRERFPTARFLCVGSPFPGNELHLENLLGLVDRLGLNDCVLYTGDVDDVKAAIASLDVLVMSSAQPEPFAGVVIEAMALKRPVVATSIGGSLEQVVDGVTGYLVEPGDPVSMADAISKLLEAPSQAREFGLNGEVMFREKFEFELFYQRILGIYRQILHEKRNVFRKAALQ